jgi:hypothetical protein
MNFLQYVMNRFVFYLQDFSVSSDQTWDEKRIQHFRGTYGPDELYRLENAVYTLLHNILKEHAQTAYIFVDVKVNTHRSVRRVWLVLMDNFPLSGISRSPKCPT